MKKTKKKEAKVDPVVKKCTNLYKITQYNEFDGNNEPLYVEAIGVELDSEYVATFIDEQDDIVCLVKNWKNIRKLTKEERNEYENKTEEEKTCFSPPCCH